MIMLTFSFIAGMICALTLAIIIAMLSKDGKIHELQFQTMLETYKEINMRMSKMEKFIDDFLKSG